MKNPKECNERREDIAALVLNELDPAAADRLTQHIHDCDTCRGFRDALAEQEQTLRSTFDAIARGVGRVEHLVERFDELSNRPETRAVSPVRRLIGGFRTMRHSRRILAAAAAIAITFTGLASWFMPGDSGGGMAFADVLEKIRVFRPHSYLDTTEYEGKAITHRVMMLTPSRRREIWPSGEVRIFDLSQGPNKFLCVRPEQKWALETTYLYTEPRSDRGLLAFLISICDGAAGAVEDLGTREVEGRPAHGFHRLDKLNDFTIWADPQTGLPIRVELVQETIGRKVVMSEFEFDVNFDESLFSTTAPEGYTVQKTEQDGVNPTEQHLLEGLRAAASFLDGQFPPTIEERAVEEVCRNHAERKGISPSDEEWKRLQLKGQRALRYVQLLETFYKATEITYVGNGVRLGDATSPVLWWKPSGSETYRVVYGDLTVRDVPPSELGQPSQR